VQDGVLRPTPALDLSARICSNSERGLLGVATEPGSDAVFLFYTAKTGSDCPTGSPNPAGAPVNRVSRFVLGADGTIDPASEVVLLDGIYANAGNHNAGDLHVGKDGHLYVSTGDAGCDYAGDSGCAGANDAARDRNVLLGKIVRITRDGGVPADNPFTGTGTASCRFGPAPAGTTCRETFASGLRNPFRMAFDPDAATTTFRINDVGQNVWEEVNQGLKGADYGWNAREGLCENTGTTSCGAPKPAGYTDPVYVYGHESGCASITGGAYVPDGVWPAAYENAYLFADYVCGKIFALHPDGRRTELASGLGGSSAVHLAFGPHAGGQALYYTNYRGGGQVRRIAYTGQADRAPTAVVSATPSSGEAPLAVTLDGSGSADPEGGALTYLWSFGDGSPDTTTTTPTVRHTYAAGRWTATLRVRDPGGTTSAPATVVVSAGNTAPVVTISSPAAGARFTVGERLVLRGSATDAQDGALPAGALSWTVIRRHADHTHPFLGPVTGNDIELTAPGPEDLAAAATSYLEVRLTATDSQGVSTTVVRDLRPVMTEVTVATAPAGRTVTVNGQKVTGPTTLTSWAGFPLTLAVAQQTDGSGRTYGFDRWSDGTTTATRTVVTPASATTLTAQLSLRGLIGAYHDAPASPASRSCASTPPSTSTGAPVRPRPGSPRTRSRRAGAARSSRGTARRTPSRRPPTTACGSGSTAGSSWTGGTTTRRRSTAAP
jgi:glucose/arabinose dehydrogenase